MRRLVALLGAVLLVASVAGSSIAAGPTDRVNRVVAAFTMLDEQGNPVGRLTANFTEPSLAKVVPGILDVEWAPYDVADAPFPFMALDWPPVKESHAQLLTAGFGVETTDPNGGIVGGAEGFLCDYTAPWNAGCRPFWVQFHIFADGRERVRFGAALEASGDPTDHVVDFWVGPGSFVLTYSGPTGS